MSYTRRRFLQGTVAGLATLPLARAAQAPARFAMQAAWVNDAEFTGYFVAIDNGYYKGEGLDFTYLSGGPDMIPETALLSRKADVALASVETATRAITEQRAPLVILGAQYQKNPMGVVSLARKPLRSPADLVGKTIAVPPVNRISMDALLRVNGIAKSSVRIVPYAYDPTPLIKGEIDGSLDFVTNVPYTIKKMGVDATSFLLWDFKLPLVNDVIVATQDTVKTRRKELVSFLRASRHGWVENLKDPAVYPKKFEASWFKGTGRSIDNELYFNQAQKPLIEAPGGVFSLSEETLGRCIEALNLLNIKANRSHFDLSLLHEI